MRHVGGHEPISMVLVVRASASVSVDLSSVCVCANVSVIFNVSVRHTRKREE